MAADLNALRLMEEINDREGIANALGRVSEDLGNQGRQAEALQWRSRMIRTRSSSCKELAYGR
jgi:hypothetical protein